MLPTQWNAIQFESNVEPFARGRDEGAVEFKADLFLAYEVDTSLEPVACGAVRSTNQNTITYVQKLVSSRMFNS